MIQRAEKKSPPADSLYLLSDKAGKPRSLCLSSRHPQTSFSLSTLLLFPFTSASRPHSAQCVAQAVPRGGGPRFPVFIGLPSAEAQLAVLLRAFSGLDSVTISYLIMITHNVPSEIASYDL